MPIETVLKGIVPPVVVALVVLLAAIVLIFGRWVFARTARQSLLDS